MSFIGKKKSGDNLRTLSEKEIQDKLYGRFRTETSRSYDRPIQTKTQTQPKSSASNSDPSVKKNGAQSDSQAQPSSVQNDFLFRGTEDAPRRPKSPQYIDEDVEKSVSSAQSQAAREQSKKYSPQPNAAAKIAPILLNAGKVIVSALLEFARIIFSGIFKAILSINFRKPAVRRTAYWLTAALLLAGIFAGIHSLNARRESAMKSPVRHKPAVKKVQKSQALSQASSQTESSQVPAETQKMELKTESKSDASVKLDTNATVSEGAPEKNQTAPEDQASNGAFSSGAYAIQIATFATQDDAKKLISNLSTGGWPVFIKPLNRPGGRTYYSVFIGRFKSNQEAEAKLASFKKSELAKPFQDAFIRSLS